MDFSFFSNLNQTLIDLLSAGVVIGLLIALVYIINRLFKWINKKIKDVYSSKIKGINIKGYDIITPRYALKLVIGGIKIIRAFLLLIIIYFWLPLLFTVLPWSKGLTEQLWDYVLTPVKIAGNAFIDYLPSLFFILVTALIVRYIIRLLKFFAEEVEREKLKLTGFYKDWAKPTYNIFRFIVYIFALVIIFPYLPGSNSPAFQGISLFVGILLSLGSTSIIANAVGGLMIIYMRPFVIGNVIKIGEVTGKVVTKNLLVTRLYTLQREEITVPNKMVIENKITNYTSEDVDKGVYLHTEITIGYDVPWRKVHEVMLNATVNIEEIMQTPEPYVLQKALNDFSVLYELNAFTEKADMMPFLYSKLHQNLQDGFAENNIEILSPNYQAVRDGNKSTVPANTNNDQKDS